MKPNDAKTKGDWCGKTCKYMKEYDHPFYNHAAWCDYLLDNLSWYDGWWIASCRSREPNPQLKLVVDLGYRKEKK